MTNEQLAECLRSIHLHDSVDQPIMDEAIKRLCERDDALRAWEAMESPELVPKRLHHMSRSDKFWGVTVDGKQFYGPTAMQAVLASQRSDV